MSSLFSHVLIGSLGAFNLSGKLCSPSLPRAIGLGRTIDGGSVITLIVSALGSEQLLVGRELIPPASLPGFEGEIG